MLYKVFPAVRVIMIHGKRRGASQPQEFAAFDFDGRHERHYDSPVIIRVVDDFHMLINEVLSDRHGQTSFQGLLAGFQFMEKERV